MALPFVVDGATVGFVRTQDVLPQIRKYLHDHHHAPSVRILEDDSAITFCSTVQSHEDRTRALEELLSCWYSTKCFPCLSGWRNEQYPVYGSEGHVLFTMERSAVGLFGIRAFGCHLNGHVQLDSKSSLDHEADRYDQGRSRMWIAKRASTKHIYPGLLDNMVGGGLPHGLGPFENICKEAQEEAGLSPELMQQIQACSAIAFSLNNPSRGFVFETNYIYDLKLPGNFTPTPQDGEVEAFFLWDFVTIQEHLLNGEFTPEAGIVVIDFMIRHGILTPNNEPDYLRIISLLRSPLVLGKLPGP